MTTDPTQAAMETAQTLDNKIWALMIAANGPWPAKSTKAAIARALLLAKAEGMRAASVSVGTWAETKYDNEPEFSAVCEIEANLRAFALELEQAAERIAP